MARRKTNRSRSAIEIADRIVVDETIRFGKPVIKGTRVPVSVLVGQAAAGLTHEEIAQEYGVAVEDVRAALRYAHGVLASEQIGLLTQA